MLWGTKEKKIDEGCVEEVVFQLSLKAKVKFELIEVRKEDIPDEKGNVREILRVKVSRVCISRLSVKI